MSAISASSISAFQQATLRNEVQTRVARKAQDVAKQQGQAAISLLEGAAQLQQQQVQTFSVEPHKGHALDLLA